MKFCEEHQITYEDMRGRDRMPCPVCEAREEISRHEVENERLRSLLREIEIIIRTSASNQHSIEVSLVAGMLASDALKCAQDGPREWSSALSEIEADIDLLKKVISGEKHLPCFKEQP